MSLVAVFRQVVELSLLGSLLAIGIWLIKRLLRQNLSPNWHYYIWLVLMLRLLFPFVPQSSFSVLNVLPHFQTVTNRSQVFTPQADVITPSEAPPTADTLPDALATGGDAQKPPTSLGVSWSVLSLIWLAGVVTIASYILLVNGLLMLRLRKQRRCDNADVNKILEECKALLKVRSKVSLVYDASLKSPALFGLFRPGILISQAIIKRISAEELRFIFLHELCHVKRRDLLVNSLWVLVQVIYWFNPLVWYVQQQIKQDCEIACDATVMAAVRPEDHKKYGQTIIELLKVLSENHWVPGTIGFASKFNTRRIAMISSFQRTTVKWAVAVLALTLVVGCSALTTPPKTPSNSQNPPSNGASQQNGATGTDQTPAPATPGPSTNPTSSGQTTPPTDATKTQLINMMSFAQQGKIINCDFPAKTTAMEVVEKAWGKADKIDYVAAAKGSYATYARLNVVFGFNKGSQIFEVRSLDK